ncbi:putative glycosyl transferase [Longispora fulva]|uniref:Glycosyltransferase involved in cell wall biosynthesis n=1 Tax=Longispora fulva TaxID=619741 RepID=A0A8J7KJI6_9ACTN|nr:glycosyltransferase family 4 protein [Longispora fulva]MBG6140445.1 glycosyltransferase involved in cell wall biosynthesis [Longispora fulva]GIG57173.1 putative glycosyl transferase [Longispora fulva]
MTTVAFVLVSWHPDAPAGMERAVAASCAGLVELGHRALILTAAPVSTSMFAGAYLLRLWSLPVAFPCDDEHLRDAITANTAAIQAELVEIMRDWQVDVAVYVDALWGLGMIMPQEAPDRRVLAAHVLGHGADVRAALDRAPHTVLAPSPVVIDQAVLAGHDVCGWQVLPNALLYEPDPAAPGVRDARRVAAPTRIMARLGPEKGVTDLLAAMPAEFAGCVEVALADAAFELQPGSQDRVRELCMDLARQSPGVAVLSALPWKIVPGWLAQAAVVIVPSLAETFGLVALEAMAGGTPVVAYAIGNLPALVGDGGVLVDPADGPEGLWRAAGALLSDPVAYGAASQAGYYRSRDYRPAHIADQLLSKVR